MASAIDPSVIGAGNVDKAAVRLQLERARDEITALENTRLLKAGDTMSGNLVISKAEPTFVLDKTASGQTNYIVGRQGGSNRWGINVGGVSTSDFSIDRYNDSSAFVDTPLTISRATGAPTFASPTLWRTGLGATATGSALFTAIDAAAGRTTLGATTVGNSLFTATDAASGRTTLNTPPLPTVSTGVGQWVAITSDGSGNYTLPAGGTWAYFWSQNFGLVSVTAGGTLLFTGETPVITRGFAWRIT